MMLIHILAGAPAEAGTQQLLAPALGESPWHTDDETQSDANHRESRSAMSHQGWVFQVPSIYGGWRVQCRRCSYRNLFLRER